uniref:GH16 domain-containing protein n=1 Tax=Timema cristinae TaxID=61476 RepID=A0A7R9CY88_TIMCR|nr:unnamed protein product [Timema cristinae]
MYGTYYREGRDIQVRSSVCGLLLWIHTFAEKRAQNRNVVTFPPHLRELQQLRFNSPLLRTLCPRSSARENKSNLITDHLKSVRMRIRQRMRSRARSEQTVSIAGQDIMLPIQSARIRTLGSFGFLYGRVEVRARMPRGDWIWPAIWMKPVDNEYGAWPSSGEIDLVEIRSNRKLRSSQGLSQGVDRMGATLHFGVNSSYNIWRPTHWEKSLADQGTDFAADYHLYGMEWTEDSIIFTVDGEKIGGVTPPEGGFWKLLLSQLTPLTDSYLCNFFLILNVAVGGRFFSDSMVNSPFPRPWNWSSPHPMRDFWERRDEWLPTWDHENSTLRVDYIRVFQP